MLLPSPGDCKNSTECRGDRYCSRKSRCKGKSYCPYNPMMEASNDGLGRIIEPLPVHMELKE